jgi:hypothetical protein
VLRNLSEIYDTTRIASVRIADIQANMSRTDSARYGIKTLFKRPPIECPLSSNLIVRSGSRVLVRSHWYLTFEATTAQTSAKRPSAVSQWPTFQRRQWPPKCAHWTSDRSHSEQAVCVTAWGDGQASTVARPHRPKYSAAELPLAIHRPIPAHCPFATPDNPGRVVADG